MPGLVGCAAPAATDARSFLDAMVVEMTRRQYRITYATAARGAFACVHHGLFNHSIRATTEDQRVGVLLDGWLFNDEADISPSGAIWYDDAAQHCLHAYMAHGIGFVKTVNGQFNLAVWDDRSGSVYLVNDRYGLRPLQYLVRNDAFYFAPSASALLSTNVISRQLNVRMVVNQLSWGRIWIGQQTLFEDILMFPPASILHWRDGRAIVSQYWDYKYHSETTIDDHFIDHAVNTFQKAVVRQTRAPLRYGVSLSGGLDSRAVLAAVAQEKQAPVNAFSWGVSELHDEVAIAHCVANRLNVPWHYIRLTPADYIAHARAGASMTDGLDLHVQSFGLVGYPLIQQHADALLTGLFLDVTLGGSYLPAPGVRRELSSSENAISWVLRKATLLSPEECLQLVRVPGAAAILEDLRREATQIWEAGGNDDPADQCDRFFLRTRGWRYIFLRQAWQRSFMEDISPTFDNAFIDCVLGIPSTWRAGHRFYQRFLQRLAPRLMDIMYQRTMLTPATPLECWPLGAELEERREELYRHIWRMSRGQVFIPYRRFSTNYDEWLRCDPTWVQMTDELLLSKESVSCEHFLNRSKVVELVEAHRSGAAANHRQILQIMTLELFLRAFVA